MLKPETLVKSEHMLWKCVIVLKNTRDHHVKTVLSATHAPSLVSTWALVFLASVTATQLNVIQTVAFAL